MIKRHLNKLKNVLASSSKSPYPTKYIPPATVSDNDNDATVITSNISAMQVHTPHHALGMLVGPLLAIANTGATLLFLTKGAPCLNKRRAITPILVTLPDGRKIFSLQNPWPPHSSDGPYHARHDNGIPLRNSNSMQGRMQSRLRQ